MSTASSYTPVLIDRALLRATGAPRSDGNAVRLLRDACENYPAWLAAIEGARADDLLRELHRRRRRRRPSLRAARSRRARARASRVRVVHDWLGCLGSHDIWDELEAAGAEVRAFNPLALRQPVRLALARSSQDDRRRRRASHSSSGLCVSARWVGDPARSASSPGATPASRSAGPAVAEIERAFAQVWDACGEPRSPMRC